MPTSATIYFKANDPMALLPLDEMTLLTTKSGHKVSFRTGPEHSSAVSQEARLRRLLKSFVTSRHAFLDPITQEAHFRATKRKAG